ncbi:MAG: DUF3140 domain-containing protein [Nocardioidaceae bacterium]
MAESHVSDELWDEFHRVVNMSSRELTEWLRVESAATDAEELPDQAGTTVGQEVVHILGKRRTDVTPEDVEVMQAVVTEVRAERGEDPLDPVAISAERDGWRRRLMSLGHDPLKPA